MGLFLFDDAERRTEIESAKAAARDVDGYGIGNEGLIGCGGNRYSVAASAAFCSTMAIGCFRSAIRSTTAFAIRTPASCSRPMASQRSVA